MLKGVVQVTALDANEGNARTQTASRMLLRGALAAERHRGLAGQYGIQGFPTIKVFVPGKAPVDYQQGRDANSMCAAPRAMAQCPSLSYLLCLHRRVCAHCCALGSANFAKSLLPNLVTKVTGKSEAKVPCTHARTHARTQRLMEWSCTA
jgi:hypothetical protein